MVEENTGTIDYGIDLGTTTSSIAKVDGNGTIVIPNKLDNKNFVSSAVYINKKGKKFIGDKAKNKIATDPKNGFAEFKLKMGSEHVYEFEATGTKMTPMELSAEILQNLRQTVKEKYQKDLKAAVITVPADFNAPQTKATTEAAKLAGFEEVVLLQEPTAAAMAYGFDASSENEIWLIYDFGGGTFDVSIMKKDKEQIVNINNQGDGYLGGKLIDWDIVDKIFVPAVIEDIGGMNDFNRANKEYIKEFAKLKKAAENAKTELSNDSTTEVEVENFTITSDGEMHDFEYDMTREELDEIMKPYVDRTINHCKKALEEVNLTFTDVTKIILVGGSTLSPYIHERLTEEFNIPLEYSIDPTTVVARGAAIFAGQKGYTPKGGGGGHTDEVTIEVNYEKIGDDPEFDVSGKIHNPNGSPEGFSVEFVNNKTKYESGRIPVNANGVFMASLVAEDKDDMNTFEIKVYDATGNLIKLSPDSVNTIKYKIGAGHSGHILSHTIGFGKYGNELYVIAKKGTPLPYEFTGTFKTASTVHAGNASEKIFLPLYEGNRMKADRNTLIGHLTITGAEIRTDLPEGSEVELTVTIDESMNFKDDSSVYIEFLDEDFDNFVIESKKEERDILQEKFQKQKERHSKLLTNAIGVNDPRIQQYFDRITDENMIGNIETFLQVGEADVDALDNASKRINDLTDILDHVEAILDSFLSWDKAKEETDQLIRDIELNLGKATPEIRSFFAQLKDMYNSAVETKNLTVLLDIKDKLTYVFAEIHENEIIQYMFLELSTSGDFLDQGAANSLIQQGNGALARGDMEELKRIVGQLHKIEKPKQRIPPEPGVAPKPRDDRLK